jgi:hypothetical protein
MDIQPTELATPKDWKKDLCSVTPVSRYMAMALFILLPFIGGLVGYTYAPSTIIETERVIIKEAPLSPEKTTILNERMMVVDPNEVLIDDTFGDFTVVDIKKRPVSPEVDITFEGTATVSGVLSLNEMLGTVITLDSESQNILPAVLYDTEIFKTSVLGLGGDVVATLPKDVTTFTEGVIYKPGEVPTYTITAEIKEFRFQRGPYEAIPTAQLVRVVDIKRN